MVVTLPASPDVIVLECTGFIPPIIPEGYALVAGQKKEGLGSGPAKKRQKLSDTSVAASNAAKINSSITSNGSGFTSQPAILLGPALANGHTPFGTSDKLSACQSNGLPDRHSPHSSNGLLPGHLPHRLPTPVSSYRGPQPVSLPRSTLDQPGSRQMSNGDHPFGSPNMTRPVSGGTNWLPPARPIVAPQSSWRPGATAMSSPTGFLSGQNTGA